MVVSSDTGNALVPATAVYTDDNNTTHVGMLRFGDCDISVDNAKISAQRENANLTFEIANLTIAFTNKCISTSHSQTWCIIKFRVQKVRVREPKSSLVSSSVFWLEYFGSESIPR